jgi:hypothetical protein
VAPRIMSGLVHNTATFFAVIVMVDSSAEIVFVKSAIPYSQPVLPLPGN